MPVDVDLAAVRRATHARLLAQAPDAGSVDRTVVAYAAGELAPLLGAGQLAQVVDEVLADIHGLGVLDALLADDDVTDVMVVGGRGVWVEKAGRLRPVPLTLTASEVEHLVQRVIAPLGLRIDRSSPMVDARLPDGSRLHAIVPPLAVDGPCLTIRRFARQPVPLERIASPAVTELLRIAVAGHQNLLVSGGTGAGKTTLLNALAAHIAPTERVITIEDAAELRLPLRHTVRLEGRPANAEGVGQVSLRELVRNALRMRPDRIIVGEVRGPEALDMLQAMNTGHEGSMSTCHANSPVDALRRVETMVMMGETGLPLDAIRLQVTSAVDLVVQIARCTNGSRRVIDVSEVGSIGSGGVEVHCLATGDQVVARPRRPLRRSA